MQAFVMAHDPHAQVVETGDDGEDEDGREQHAFDSHCREGGMQRAVQPAAWLLISFHVAVIPRLGASI